MKTSLLVIHSDIFNATRIPLCCSFPLPSPFPPPPPSLFMLVVSNENHFTTLCFNLKFEKCHSIWPQGQKLKSSGWVDVIGNYILTHNQPLSNRQSCLFKVVMGCFGTKEASHHCRGCRSPTTHCGQSGRDSRIHCMAEVGEHYVFFPILECHHSNQIFVIEIIPYLQQCLFSKIFRYVQSDQDIRKKEGWKKGRKRSMKEGKRKDKKGRVGKEEKGGRRYEESEGRRYGEKKRKKGTWERKEN